MTGQETKTGRKDDTGPEGRQAGGDEIREIIAMIEMYLEQTKQVLDHIEKYMKELQREEGLSAGTEKKTEEVLDEKEEHAGGPGHGDPAVSRQKGVPGAVLGL